ncbi:MAG: hypothetical protein NC086_04445 [Alistipes sp.]|nr:hypothetical protein [Alistipes sp.]
MGSKKKDILLKKEKGASGALDYIPIVLLAVFGAWIFLQTGLQLKYLDTINRIQDIAGRYIRIMETQNGMTAPELEKFYRELSELGISDGDIDMEGTTFWDGNIQYGDEIYLKVRMKVPYGKLTVSDPMEHVIENRKKEVSIEKCALALA